MIASAKMFYQNQWYTNDWPIFHSKNFDVKDTHVSDQAIIDNIDEIFQKIRKDCHKATYDMVASLNIDQESAFDHLLRTVYREKREV